MLKSFSIRYAMKFTILAMFMDTIFLGLVNSVSISDMRVPAVVKNGTNSVILDCEYSLRLEEQSPISGLVVKWFFNNQPKPVYQWIYNKKPQDLGVLKGRLKLDYKASDSNFTMYRALYIWNPTTELTGQYKCLVSTNAEEDFMIKKMVVYAPEKRLEFYHQRLAGTANMVNVTCRAIGAYPEPVLTIYNHTSRLISPVVERWSTYVNRSQQSIRYDTRISVKMTEAELALPTSLECEISLPGTPYVNRKILLYYPGSTESLSSVSDKGVSARGSLCLLIAIAVVNTLFN